MITPVLPIAILAAASLLGQQQPALNALLLKSPVLLQLTETSIPNAQVKASDPKAKVTVPATNADDLFAGTEKFAQGATESTEINLDPDSMQMVGSKKNGELARKMKTMVIRSYKYDKPGMYKMEDIEVYRKKLEDGSWKCSVRVREKNESTDICSRLGPDHETREMVILTAEPKEITFIHMSGQMSLDELDHAANGLQHH
jgi:hypothetical protein